YEIELGCVLMNKNYFFFQAEDGIRDFHVTGVQTCALPIFRRVLLKPCGQSFIDEAFHDRSDFRRNKLILGLGRELGIGNLYGKRSEERRVGKGCRTRWLPMHQEK